MKINVQKTKAVTIAKSPQNLQLIIDGIKIQQVNEFTYLGQSITDDLFKYRAPFRPSLSSRPAQQTFHWLPVPLPRFLLGTDFDYWQWKPHRGNITNPNLSLWAVLNHGMVMFLSHQHTSCREDIKTRHCATVRFIQLYNVSYSTLSVVDGVSIRMEVGNYIAWRESRRHRMQDVKWLQ